MKICQKNSNLFKIWQKHEALYVKTYVCFIIAGDMKEFLTAVRRTAVRKELVLSWKQRLHEHATVSCCMYITCLVFFCIWHVVC